MGELTVCSEGSKFIKALSECTKTPISSDVTAIKFLGSFDRKIVGPNVVFIRDFYVALLTLIRSYDRCVMIGNPGISKSVFQYFYLMWILNPELVGPLLPDYRGCTDPPKVVIRQVGNLMTIYDIEKRVAYHELPANEIIVGYFDPEVTLYLYEPGLTKGKEPMDVDCPTFATVLPDTSRYKYFSRHGGAHVYMPVYKLKELLDIGKYLLDKKQVPEAMRGEYSPVNITLRYEEFGGIIRHVLPVSMDRIRSTRQDISLAIEQCDPKRLLSGSIIDGWMSDHIKQMDVLTEGDNAFKVFQTCFTSDYVVRELQETITAIDLKDRVKALMRNDALKYPDLSCASIYESVLADLFILEGGVKWKARVSAINNTYIDFNENHWSSYNVKLSKIVRGSIPKFSEMKSEVLYYPRHSNHSAVDFFFKSSINGTDCLSAFQVTIMSGDRKDISISAYQEFIKSVGLEDSSNIRLYLIPRSTLAKMSSINFTTGDVVESVEVEVEIGPDSAGVRNKDKEGGKKKGRKSKKESEAERIAVPVLELLKKVKLWESYTIEIPGEYYS